MQETTDSKAVSWDDLEDHLDNLDKNKSSENNDNSTQEAISWDKLENHLEDISEKREEKTSDEMVPIETVKVEKKKDNPLALGNLDVAKENEIPVGIIPTASEKTSLKKSLKAPEIAGMDIPPAPKSIEKEENRLPPPPSPTSMDGNNSKQPTPPVIANDLIAEEKKEESLSVDNSSSLRSSNLSSESLSMGFVSKEMSPPPAPEETRVEEEKNNNQKSRSKTMENNEKKEGFFKKVSGFFKKNKNEDPKPIQAAPAANPQVNSGSSIEGVTKGDNKMEYLKHKLNYDQVKNKVEKNNTPLGGNLGAAPMAEAPEPMAHPPSPEGTGMNVPPKREVPLGDVPAPELTGDSLGSSPNGELAEVHKCPVPELNLEGSSSPVLENSIGEPLGEPHSEVQVHESLMGKTEGDVPPAAMDIAPAPESSEPVPDVMEAPLVASPSGDVPPEKVVDQVSIAPVSSTPIDLSGNSSAPVVAPAATDVSPEANVPSPATSSGDAPPGEPVEKIAGLGNEKKERIVF